MGTFILSLITLIILGIGTYFLYPRLKKLEQNINLILKKLDEQNKKVVDIFYNTKAPRRKTFTNCLPPPVKQNKDASTKNSYLSELINNYNGKVDSKISKTIEDIYKNVTRLDQDNTLQALSAGEAPGLVESNAGTYISIPSDKDSNLAYVMPRLPFTLDNHRYVSGAIKHIFDCSPPFNSNKRYDKVKLKCPAEFQSAGPGKWVLYKKGMLDLS